MSKENLVYNEPFEIEKWVWKIKDTEYFINKYRKIDCDEEVGYYYDFNMFEFSDINKNKLFTIRKYNDENHMSFLCNPYLIINEDVQEIVEKLKEKYKVNDFYYLDREKGYTKIEMHSSQKI